ncbi:SDR family NAD(P)-dependent oxidoreductase [uncultured Eubacterium sp.]|uniref:SDR family NAD(P)-dependent oxidoreductase n=1 Tax=uncultured Eubacterium sp. TaxID=165185 RepID=UPI0015A8E9C5|nr:SDR family NAD(P)-dependent oxidoreductase [uncultured Eubacterium sp.]
MRYALVTGATSGLGKEIAIRLSESGWCVFACGRNEKALKEIKTSTYCRPLKMDVVDQESINEAFKEVSSVTDHLDAIINFSGIQKMSSLIEGDINIIKQSLDVNLLGMARVNKTFFPLIKKCNGRIVNCSSECGWMTPQPFNGSYTLSKYAVEAYNDSLRRELMFLDIPVIKIQPGSFKTAMHGKTLDSFDKLINSTNMYRDVLEKMKGMMLIELKMANEPEALIHAVMKAVNDPHPRQKYRVKNSPLLGVIEVMHPMTVDRLYKKFLKSEKVASLMEKVNL